MQAIGTSEAPFDRWFRDTMEQVHGIDLAESAPPPQLIMDAKDQLAAGHHDRALSMLNGALNEIDSATDVVVPEKR